MQKFKVKVKFEGTVTVDVPDYLSEEAGKNLAENLTLAKMLATDNNPDCCECLESACEEFIDFCKDTKEIGTEEDFDISEISEIGGQWSIIES